MQPQLWGRGNERKETIMADKESIILGVLTTAGKPLKAGDIAEAAGLDKAEVAKILGVLKKQGKVGSPKMCFYAPA
jgi:chromosome segregation and condensation protein ScpB